MYNNRVLFIGIMVLSVITMLFQLLALNPQVLIGLVLAGAISLAYTIPVIPFKGRYIRLRDISFAKAFLIALVVASVTFLLPLLVESDWLTIWSLQNIFLFSERILFVLAITIPFDIRDKEYDEKTKLKTLATTFGVKGSITISVLILMTFIVAVSVHYYLIGGLNFNIYIALSLSAIIAALIISKSNPGKSEYFYSLLVEGTMIIQLLLIILSSSITK